MLVNIGWIVFLLVNRNEFRKNRFILEIVAEEILLLYTISILLIAMANKEPGYSYGLAIFAVVVIFMQLLMNALVTIYVLFKTIRSCLKKKAKVYAAPGQTPD